MAASREEEALVRKRLLCKDSVVPSSAPSVQNCAKRMRKLVENVEADSVAECEANAAAVAKQLDMYEFEMGKNDVVGETCAHERSEYTALHASITERIASTSASLEALRNDLRAAKAERAHKEECEALAAAVNKYPSRVETGSAIDALRAEETALMEQDNAVRRQLDLRSKQFRLLMHSIYELRATLLDEAAAASGADEDSAAAGGTGQGTPQQDVDIAELAAGEGAVEGDGEEEDDDSDDEDEDEDKRSGRRRGEADEDAADGSGVGHEGEDGEEREEGEEGEEGEAGEDE